MPALFPGSVPEPKVPIFRVRCDGAFLRFRAEPMGKPAICTLEAVRSIPNCRWSGPPKMEWNAPTLAAAEDVWRLLHERGDFEPEGEVLRDLETVISFRRRG